MAYKIEKLQVTCTNKKLLWKCGERKTRGQNYRKAAYKGKEVQNGKNGKKACCKEVFLFLRARRGSQGHNPSSPFVSDGEASTFLELLNCFVWSLLTKIRLSPWPIKTLSLKWFINITAVLMTERNSTNIDFVSAHYSKLQHTARDYTTVHGLKIMESKYNCLLFGGCWIKHCQQIAVLVDIDSDLGLHTSVSLRPVDLRIAANYLKTFEK